MTCITAAAEMMDWLLSCCCTEHGRKEKENKEDFPCSHIQHQKRTKVIVFLKREQKYKELDFSFSSFPHTTTQHKQAAKN